MVSPAATQRLRTILTANAVFSSTSGLVIAAASAPLAGAMGGVPSWLLPAIGVGLVGFGAFCLYASRLRDPSRLRAEAIVITIADALWVAGSIPVAALAPVSAFGRVAVLAAAGAVAVFAVAEFVSLRDRSSAPAGGAVRSAA